MKKKTAITLVSVVVVLAAVVMISLLWPEKPEIISQHLGIESAEIFNDTPQYLYEQADHVVVGTLKEIHEDQVFCIPGGRTNGGYPATVATFQAEEYLKGELDDTFDFCYVGGTIPMVEHMKNDYSLPADEIPDQVEFVEEVVRAYQEKDPEGKNLFQCTTTLSERLKPGHRYLLMLKSAERGALDYPSSTWTGNQLFDIDEEDMVYIHQYDRKMPLSDMIGLLNDPEEAAKVWPWPHSNP